MNITKDNHRRTAARTAARYETGDPNWVYVIIGPSKDPEASLEALRKAGMRV